jgi:integrase
VINMNFVSHRLQNNNPPLIGKAIAARLARRQQDARALAALDLVNGATRPSRRQAAKLMGVTRYRIASAELATADEIECLKLGRLRLSDVRKAHAKPRPLTDAEIESFIANADPYRVLAIVDRLTAPTLAAAE